MIEDTSFVIDLLHGEPAAVQYLQDIEENNYPEKLAAITVLELYEAVPQLDIPEKRRRRILDVLDSRRVVASDKTVMRKAGELSGELVSRGKQIDREDCIIAATALLSDEPVVTRNEHHFSRIDGLDVQVY